MRIDAYNQVAQLYGIQKNLKTQKAQNAAGPRDQVSQLKSMIDAGTYSVEPGDFASKLLEKYNA